MKTALISVSDKTNIKELVEFLLNNDFQIISSGGTFKLLKENFESNNIISVEEYTGSPEMLGGRVKTLHPKIHGGILARQTDSDLNDLEKNNITSFDLVVCNLYPFKKVISGNHTYDDAIENIDIGGVTLIRSSFKNYKYVTILTDSNDYNEYIDNFNNIMENNDNKINFNKKCALKAMEHISDYDSNITTYFNKEIQYRKFSEISKLKYGCNPHQIESSIHKLENEFPFKILNGKPGYINYMDAIQSWCLVTELFSVLKIPCAASFKHTTPAGVGTSRNLPEAYHDIYKLNKEEMTPVSTAFVRARTADPMSSFGDFIAIYGNVDLYTAKLIKREVSDGIIALSYSVDAYELLKKKKDGKYIILEGSENILNEISGKIEYRELNGIGLSQNVNNFITNDDYFKNIPTNRNTISNNEKEDLIIGNITLKYTPSNSIVFAYDGQVIGVGAGQQNRVDCVKLAGNKAIKWALTFHPKTLSIMNYFKDTLKRQERVNAIIQFLQFNKNTDSNIDKILLNKWIKNFLQKEFKITIEDFITSQETEDFISKMNISLASDAFFPFSDNIDYAYKFGVKNILQPGGSIADKDVINSCNDYNMYMTMSNVRVFTH